MRTPELTGVTVVAAGSFNPAIMHPLWLAEKGLIPDNLAEHAVQQEEGKRLTVSPELATFVADWLTVQVTATQAVFATVDQGRELDLRDVAKGVWELLPETPVDAIGINADSHFKTDGEEAWHAFGDQFLPKVFWEPLFQGDAWKPRGSDAKRVGMRQMRVEVQRNDDETPGFVRIELAPSARIGPHGVYVGINAHFQLRKGEKRSTAGIAAATLGRNWETVRRIESDLLTKLLEAV